MKSHNSTASQQIEVPEIATADGENRGSSSRVPAKSDDSSDVGQRMSKIRSKKPNKQKTLPL